MYAGRISRCNEVSYRYRVCREIVRSLKEAELGEAMPSAD